MSESWALIGRGDALSQAHPLETPKTPGFKGLVFSSAGCPVPKNIADSSSLGSRQPNSDIIQAHTAYHSMTTSGTAKKQLDRRGSIFGSICLYVVLPLLPILGELLVRGPGDGLSLMLAGSVYCLAIAISSERNAVYGGGLAVAFLCAMFWGFSSQIPLVAGATTRQVPFYLPLIASIGILAVAVAHGFERKERHGDDEKQPVTKVRK